MTQQFQERLLDAVLRCLRPIARLLLGAGVGYPQFENLAKRAFIEEALGPRDERGRLMNVSRVAVRTGLSRKEIARFKSLVDSPLAGANTFQIGRPARALQLWHSEPDFLDENGAPVDLPFDDEEPSFSSLVRRVGGDVPVGAVRAELLSAGGMIELDNGRLRAQKRFFVPSEYGEDLIVGMAFIVEPLLETLSHNLENPKGAFIQRIAYSDHLPSSKLKAFRDFSHDEAADLMQSVDKWIAGNESGREVAEDISRRVGVGVFYFENSQITPK